MVPENNQLEEAARVWAKAMTDLHNGRTNRLISNAGSLLARSSMSQEAKKATTLHDLRTLVDDLLAKVYLSPSYDAQVLLGELEASASFVKNINSICVGIGLQGKVPVSTSILGLMAMNLGQGAAKTTEGTRQ